MSPALPQGAPASSADHLMVTMVVWNHRHRLNAFGQGWFSYASGPSWEAVSYRLLGLARGVEGATVRFVGEGVDPSVGRATFFGGASLDPAAAKSAVCLVETVAGGVDALRAAFRALLEDSGLVAGWFMPSPLGVALPSGALAP